FWLTDEQSYSPLVALAVLYLFWSLRTALPTPRPRFGAGFALVLAGLLVYVVGRSQGLMALEAGSALAVTTGVVLACGGIGWLRVLWFPVFYLVFLIPLPNMFVDAVTGPLKVFASNLAESILYAANYPI